MAQVNSNSRSWQFNRQVNLTVIIQLLFLASLILGSWVNIQRRLDLLQHDVGVLLQTQEQFQEKLEQLSAKSITHEYRLQAIEKWLLKENLSDGPS
jgi:hypothetical protein